MMKKDSTQDFVLDPRFNWTWPLNGKGIDKLGVQGLPVKQPMPECGPDELLIRHDAVGLCSTDLKEINYGSDHPRFEGRSLENEPVVPGHEASISVVAVGQNLRDRYHINDRFTIQPDVKFKGKSKAYSFILDGAYRQFGVVGEEILNGDEGNYLISVPSDFTYAGAALSEPWACVDAAYNMKYRTSVMEAGRLWIMAGSDCRQGYRLDGLWAAAHAPAQVIVSNAPQYLQQELERLCQESGVACFVHDSRDVLASEEQFSDIIVLDGAPADLKEASAHLAKHGVFVIAGHYAAGENIDIDTGRIHYDLILYTGCESLRLADAYPGEQFESDLNHAERTWIIGAAGPMGMMHVQRAIKSSKEKRMILATDINNTRLQNLWDSYADMAAENNVDLVVRNPVQEPEEYMRFLKDVCHRGGFDYVTVMVPNQKSFLGIEQYMAVAGVVNLFAGLKLGTCIPVSLHDLVEQKKFHFVGHSGSDIKDQTGVVQKNIKGELQIRKSVAAICGFLQVPDALDAMGRGIYTGKIVMYPAVPDFPVTALQELKDSLPEVYEKLEGGRFWTVAAENAFLNAMKTK